MSNLPTVQSSQFSPAEIELLRTTYAKGLSDTELSLFLKQSEAMNLNPFTKEIYGMIVSERLVLITSINGLRKIAHAAGNYVGCSVSIKSESGKLISARAKVRKLVAGTVAEFESEVMFDEYNTGKNNWVKMPQTMLKKVAEAHALRMAYPSVEELYEESELGAIKRQPRDSAKAQELTAKFSQSESRDVSPHPALPGPEKEADSFESAVGDFIVPIGKHTSKKLKEVPPEDILKFLDWAEVQSELTPGAKEYYEKARAFTSQGV